MCTAGIEFIGELRINTEIRFVLTVPCNMQYNEKQFGSYARNSEIGSGNAYNTSKKPGETVPL